MTQHEIVVECPCGVIIRSSDQDVLIADTQQHATEAHGMTLERQQVLDMARPA